jgi:antitoxin HicB
MGRLFKVPLLLSANDTGGYRVTSPDLPELLAEGDTADEAILQAHAALVSVIELYEYLRKPFPATQCLQIDGRPVPFEGVIVRP